MEERDDSPTSNRHDHPYGDVGKQAGEYAHMLLEYLSQSVAGPPEYIDHGWHCADGDALQSLGEFEYFLVHTRATAEVSAEEMQKFDSKLAAFQTALPFTEAERYWLVKGKGRVAVHYEHIEKSIGQHEEEVVSAGIRKVINGRDLMRRWLAWRRETDEYANQGTLDIAREALRGMVEMLNPGEELPVSYVLLRTVDPS